MACWNQSGVVVGMAAEAVALLSLVSPALLADSRGDDDNWREAEKDSDAEADQNRKHVLV
jgi:hypothetical protein